MRNARHAAVVAAALAGGCALGPDYQRPRVDLPEVHRQLAPRAATPASAPSPAGASERLARADAMYAAVQAPPAGSAALLDTAWWSAFGDARLDELIRIAIDENKDLRIAAHRIEQADAYLQVAKSQAYPQAGYRAERTRDALSQNRQVPLQAGVNPVDNSYLGSAAVSWELDLWGKFARSSEAAYAELAASEEARRALMQSLVAEVAATYVRLLAVDREIDLLRQSIEANREAVRLAESAFRNGGNSELPVLNALASLHQRQSDLPTREAESAALENALAALLGRDPGPIARGKPIDALALPQVPGGLPAELLAQRPDVRRAEDDLVAANARIGVAKAQYLPQISLTASSGYASNELSKLAMLSSNFGSFGVVLLGPLFTAGRIAGQVREAEAKQKEAAVVYVRSVQTALREVDDALAAHLRSSQQSGIRALQVKALAEQRTLAQNRFAGGFTSYFPVIDAEQAYTAGLLLQNESRREQFRALIAVYKAMGGGWALPDVTGPRKSAALVP